MVVEDGFDCIFKLTLKISLLFCLFKFSPHLCRIFIINSENESIIRDIKQHPQRVFV